MAVKNKARKITPDKVENKEDLIPENEEKWRKWKTHMEELKLYVFEQRGYGRSCKSIADELWYTQNYIEKISSQINNEFRKKLQEKKEDLIAEQVQRVEAISLKLFKVLNEIDDKKVTSIVNLHWQLLRTQEYLAKLQGLLSFKVEVKEDKEEILTDEEQEKINKLLEE